MKTIKISALALALTLVTACDNEIVKGLNEERASRQYQAAMDDYAAGRMDAAVEGLKKVISRNPGNASARFQLACLLQDHSKDMLGAICSYRDFILLQPDSEKTKLAKARLAICERLLGEEFAKQAGQSTITAEKAAKLLSDIKVLEAARSKLSTELEAKNEEISRLSADNENLRRLIASLKAEGSAEKVQKTDIMSVRKLLDGEDPETSMKNIFAEAKELDEKAEAEDRAAERGASILPVQPGDAKAKRDAADEAAKKARQAQKSTRPSVYVVQEGDTLYKIANRFYGRTSAWKLIREANKSIISSDGRVRAGQTIKLP